MYTYKHNVNLSTIRNCGIAVEPWLWPSEKHKQTSFITMLGFLYLSGVSVE